MMHRSCKKSFEVSGPNQTNAMIMPKKKKNRSTWESEKTICNICSKIHQSFPSQQQQKKLQ